MSAIEFQMFSDTQGQNAFAPKFTATNQATTLDPASEQHFTVPSDFDKWVAIFSYSAGSDVFVACNETAAIPESTFEETASVLLPAVRFVNAGDVLSFISAESAIVGVSLYGIP